MGTGLLIISFPDTCATAPLKLAFRWLPYPTTTTFDNAARTSVSQSQSEASRFQQDHTLSYDKNFGNGHNINAVAGFTTIYNKSSSVGGTRRDTLLNVPMTLLSGTWVS